MAHLDTLPSEVQSMILRQVPSIEALWSLICASPRYFQIFRLYKYTVLPHVVANQFGPNLLPLALQRHQLGRGDPDDLAASTSKSPSDLSILVILGLSLENLQEVLKFHRVVNSFAKSFVQDRLSLATQAFAPKSSEQKQDVSVEGTTRLEGAPTLSRSEYFRLARALYHIEIYSMIFQNQKLARAQYPPYYHSRIFLQSLDDWELEEFLCIRSYLVERVASYLDQVEDDYMQVYLDDEPYIIETRGADSRWETEDWFFSSASHGLIQEGWLESCLIRGLKVLRTMLTAEKAENRMYTLGDTDFIEDPLGLALNALPVRPSWEITKRNKLQPRCHYDKEEGKDGRRSQKDSDVEACCHPNKAWKWSMKYQEHPRCSSNYAYDEFLEGHRRWGYLIWDRERLERWGIFEKE